MCRLFGLTVIALTALVANASATLITFDDGQPNGSAIGSFYSGLGVTFTNAAWTNNFGFAGSSGNQAVMSITGGYQPQPSDPIKATFSSLVSSVTLRGIDVGVQGFWLKAFDETNALIDSQVVFGTGGGGGQYYDLTVNGSIQRVEFSQDHTGSGDGAAFENLSFTTAPVPEPTTLAALSFGAITLIKRRRKR